MTDFKTRLTAHLREISVPGNRFTDTAGIQHRETYIRSTLSKIGVNFKSQSFTAWGTEGRNIIVSIESTKRTESKIIIGSHYDTVPFSPGANDNSSSVSCLLSLIEEIVSHGLAMKSHLEVCFWDMEEVGKKGSEFYTKNLEGSSKGKYSAIVLEMLGWRCFKPFSQKIPLKTVFRYPKMYVSSLINLHRADFHLIIGRKGDLNAIFGDGFPINYRIVIAPDNLATSESLGLCDSDHHNFWKTDIPAILITDTGKYRRSSYHTSQDVLEQVDVDFILPIFHWLVKVVST